jgi:hypothetical protein
VDDDAKLRKVGTVAGGVNRRDASRTLNAAEFVTA